MDLQEMSYENTNWFWKRFEEELWLRLFLGRLNDHRLFIKTLLMELITKLRVNIHYSVQIQELEEISQYSEHLICWTLQ